MKLFIVALLGLTLSSCKIGCKLEDTMVSGMTSATTKVLSCKNTAAIEKSMRNVVGKIGLCRENKKLEGPLGFVCGVLVSAAVDQLANKVPAEWECDPTLAKEGLKAALSLACAAIPI